MFQNVWIKLVWYMNVYKLNPVQFNTNTDVGEFVFICTSININALKVLTFHWKHTCAVDLLHVKCCENMPTQPHRCHETLNSYKTNVFLIQSTILFFMQFSSDIVKNSPSDEALCLVRFKFTVCCFVFFKHFAGYFFFYPIVFWYCESFFHWWSLLLLGGVVQLLVFFVCFMGLFGGSLE